MRTARSRAIVACALAVGLATATIADANTFGPPLLFPDNAKHTLCTTQAVRDSVNATSAVGWSRERVDATDMSAVTVASCTSVTDVRYLRAAIGSETLGGVEQCKRVSPTGLCDSADVTFNSTALDGRSLDLWRAIGCHETGHSLGLGHSDTRASCMFSVADESAGTSRFYDGHDLGHINGRW